jgi:Zn-finger nucleic acid-binding protein
MQCPNCAAEMTPLTLDAHLTAAVTTDICTQCQAFWFDKYESLKLSPASTLKLLQFIGEHSSSPKVPQSEALHCPRCSAPLRHTNDMQRTTRFSYRRCPNEHGRFITFFDFLKEKNFIRPLTPQQITVLRQSVQTVNCSNCGAPIDLTTASVCAHCGSPLSMLDMTQPEQLVAQLKQAAAPRPIDPALPLKVARATRDVERLFGPVGFEPEWSSSSGAGLVEAGLSAFVEWLKKSGI